MPIRIKTKDGVVVESDPTAIKRDGSQPPTANIPWNSKKITGLADGTDPNDAINLGQLTSHTTDTNNPHSVTFTQAVAADGTTNISGAEAETLTDGSDASTLHIHDARYYTETELDAGQLDNRYYTESEYISSSAGAGDAGKPIVLDAGGQVDASMINDGDISHLSITDIGTNTHAQIDSHISDSTIHFTEGSIDHTNITNIGTNTHAQIDTHIASTANPHSVDADDVSPLTTKGDLWAFTTVDTRLGVGSNGEALIADSGEATGLNWGYTDQIQNSSGDALQIATYITNDVDYFTDNQLSQNSNTFFGVDVIGGGGLSHTTADEGYYNTAIGNESGFDLTTGYNNTLIGSNAGENITSGFNNTLIGKFTGSPVTSGNRNTCIGSESLANGTSVAQCTAVGYRTLYSNQATGLVALGMQALENNTTGVNNTAVGTRSLNTCTTGQSNTALGIDTLKGLTTGGGNVAIGRKTLEALTTGSNNLGLGTDCLTALTTASDNTCIGANSAAAVTSGTQNASIGRLSLGNATTGSQNTALGYQALHFLQSGSAATTITNCSGLGYDSRVSGNNQVQLGDSATTTYAYGAVQNRSDKRDKTDILDTDLGLDFITALRPVKFRWDYREDYFEKVINDDGVVVALNPLDKDGSKKRARFHQGLIAQEVKAVMDEQGVDFAGYQDHSLSGGDDVLSIGYTELIAPLIKAIQEQQEIIEDLTLRLEALETE